MAEEKGTPLVRKCEQGNLQRTMRILEPMEGKHRSAEVWKEKLMKESQLLISPVLLTFLLIGLRPCLDVYAKFLFEPISLLLLDVSGMSNECV